MLENGGNTTLLGAVIFPYIGSLDQFADGGTMASSIPADLQHKPSPDDDPFEEKWALICVGMGDCELHYFKLNVRQAKSRFPLPKFPNLMELSCLCLSCV